MRLTDAEIGTIKTTIREYVPDATITLFGSRVDDTRRGGDIDLCVETTRNLGLKDELFLLTALEKAGISRHIDLILKTPKRPHQAIYETIRKEGIAL